MAKAFAEIAAGGEADGLGHHEWLGLLLDRETSSWRQDKRLAARLAALGIPPPDPGREQRITASDSRKLPKPNLQGNHAPHPTNW